MLGLGFDIGNRSLNAGGVAGPAFVMAHTANVAVTDLGNLEYELEKTAGTDWAESARSTTAMAGNFLLRVQPRSSGVGNDAMLGVNTDPLTSDHYNTIDYAIYFNGGTTLDVYENGASPLVITDLYAANDYAFFKRVGSTLTLYLGGTDGTGATNISTLATYTEAGVLYFDSSFASAVGKKFRVKRLS